MPKLDCRAISESKLLFENMLRISSFRVCKGKVAFQSSVTDSALITVARKVAREQRESLQCSARKKRAREDKRATDFWR